MKKFITLFALIMVSIISLTGCSGGFRFLKASEIKDLPNPTGKIYLCIYNEETGEKYNDKDYVFEFELYYKSAPNTVANFIKLVDDGFYDGLMFENLMGYGKPFITFGQNEFFEEIIYDEDDEEKEIRRVYYKKELEPEFNIVGEFFVNGWEVEDENKVTSGAGSLIMVRKSFDRDDYEKTGNTNFNTAYAAFNIQVKASTVQYEESFCVFGKLTTLPSGIFSSAGVEQELLDFFFNNNDHSYNANYSTSNRIKFMISKIEMDADTADYGNPLRVGV
ncbi:MAG: peptidylprolyl isomerase [Firmicutes bacterium]|nr:peptidylprolyl isomerase [Bacillota bacterium]